VQLFIRNALLLAIVAVSLVRPSVAEEPKNAPKVALKQVDSWGYQLQNVRSRFVAKDKFDILVVDYSRDGTDARAFKPDAVDRIRKRSNQASRLVLSYLSIGEAEAYRYYWQPAWATASSSVADVLAPIGFRGASSGASSTIDTVAQPLAQLTPAAPAWLSDENPAWRGNFLVKYWDAQWQNIIFGSPTAYLDKIIDAGFDGVYLDKIDANDDWQKTRPTAERDMVAFVAKLAAYARQRKPGFLIVPQNGEELLEHPDYVKVIDAIAKEDLLFGGGSRKDGEPNPRPEILKSVKHLKKALNAGKKVLAVEYLSELDQIIQARKRLLGVGFVPYFARRALDEPPFVESAPAPVIPATAPR
jgi:cysteinyl-tRNA synthetase, unknown class